MITLTAEQAEQAIEYAREALGNARKYRDESFVAGDFDGHKQALEWELKAVNFINAILAQLQA